MKEKRYSVGQAAKYIGRSVSTMQRLDRDNELKAHRTDTNRRYYTKGQLDLYKLKRKAENEEDYFLKHYTFSIKKRDDVIARVLDSYKVIKLLDKGNVVLVGTAGIGKESLFNKVCQLDDKREYLGLFTGAVLQTSYKMTKAILQGIFKNAEAHANKTGKNVVLYTRDLYIWFMWPLKYVNLISQLPKKYPHVRLLGCMTPKIYRDFVELEKGVNNRLMPFDVPELPRKDVLDILHEHASKYKVLDKLKDPEAIFNRIYDYTQDKIQPQSSLEIFDLMIGYFQTLHLPIDDDLIKMIINKADKEN